VLASCDVAAAMMEQPAGRAIVEETIDEALAFRRAVAAVRRTSGGSWWFALWQPPALADYPVADPSRWRLNPADRWHGFGTSLPEDVLLDPVKVTLLTPGHRADERTNGPAIPAAVVTAFLASRGIDVQRSGMYSFRVTFSVGIPEGRWSTLITELLNFREFYDRNAPVREVLPHLANDHPQAYAAIGWKDLCARVHAASAKLAGSGSQDDPYGRPPEMAMRPADAHDQLVRGTVESVEIDGLIDRIVAIAITPDLQGLPLLMPGERITRETLAIQQYLVRARQFDAECPGLEVGLAGVEVDGDGPSRRYVVTCLRK
jgi:arginine decarboxylase